MQDNKYLREEELDEMIEDMQERSQQTETLRDYFECRNDYEDGTMGV